PPPSPARSPSSTWTVTTTRSSRLLPGEALVLYTDGMEDARDAAGEFFPLQAALTEAARAPALSPQCLIHSVQAELLRHTGRLPSDDATLLVVRNDRTRARAPHPEPECRARTMS
ncbi:SpoIIE family protein phosphatase, partial [Streptomyces sp. NPDC005904]|uniref:SpoIIE family protein phosphatase n=1 Tax=Streptomyces sp. NPDC005904 TaxID=3154570 RepID=UPI003411CF39